MLQAGSRPTVLRRLDRARGGRLVFSGLPLFGGCGGGGAPSFVLFGAYFPGWMLCGVIGVAGAAIARATIVRAGLSNALPYPLFLCTALGTLVAVLAWRVCFG